MEETSQSSNEKPWFMQNPPFPNKFKRGDASWFNRTDKPTLAGKAVIALYGGIIARDSSVEVNKSELLKRCRIAKREFKRYVGEVNLNRGFRFSFSRRHSESAGFHHDNKQNPLYDHSFYFHHPHWEGISTAKAYITLSPNEADNSHRHFVDLCAQLYDGGIYFVAKGSSPKGVLQRTDNLIFYIDHPHKARATQIIKDFLMGKKIAQGNVPGSVPSVVDGLSWAREPTRREGELWQKITGSSIAWNQIGWNGVRAGLMIPHFFEAIAGAHAEKGHKKVAALFRKEAARVNRLIEHSRATGYI